MFYISLEFVSVKVVVVFCLIVEVLHFLQEVQMVSDLFVFIYALEFQEDI